ncbi:MliC family protein [Histidinibacterium aquaticum]|nr:MliC family protein [Histidinibacterium aquaticum]
MHRTLVTFALFAAAPALAQEGPSLDCAAAESSAEELICEDDALAALDRRLAERFSAALAAAEGLDAGAEEAAAELRATQRGWIGGRDECWQTDGLRSCVEAAYLRREGQLVALWMLEEPAATATYLCAAEGPLELTALYFDTELPSARLEWGDRVDAATLTPAASGSRYEGSFGTFLWDRGEEAIFSVEGGEELACTAG